jgi:aspartyl-tRNA(Asn)/glutamyl-tRNA(Gln) amidotransferase subunit A
MLGWSLQQLAQGLRQKQFSSVELTKFYLDRITTWQAAYNCFITITPELAMQQAAQADQRLAAGDPHPLLGIPLAHKDIFCTQGIKTTCASKMLDNFIAPYNATIVARLNAAGMVLLGKTNMDEFAMGASNETSFYGPVRNPWQPECVPGGSSGGSAAAVAAQLVPIATGTDTGGSIRQPAALCGITGLKPTYGRVSRYGMVAFASSLDQAGMLGFSAADCAVLLEYIAGFDALDSTSSSVAVPAYSQILGQAPSGLTIGLPNEFFNDDLNPEVAKNIEAAIQVLQSLGYKFKTISLPSIRSAICAYYVLAPAEASSNLARFDGVRYGYRCDKPRNLEDLYVRSRTEAFGEEVKRRIMLGTYVLSSGFYDAYYLKAQQVKQVIAHDFHTAFAEVDLILGPTTPSPAFKLGERTADPVSMYYSDAYTVSVNLAGLPAISVPSGFAEGLPLGMQLIGNRFTEALLLQVAHQYQQVTDWHLQRANVCVGK